MSLSKGLVVGVAALVAVGLPVTLGSATPDSPFNVDVVETVWVEPFTPPVPAFWKVAA